MKRRFQKQRLAAAILLHLAIAGGAGQVWAMTSSQISHEGRPLFSVNYYGAEDEDNDAAMDFFAQFGSQTTDTLAYTLTDNIKAGLDNAFRQWAEMLGPGAQNRKPLQYFVGTNDIQNAGALSFSQRGNVDTNNPNYLHAALQKGAKIQWLDSIEALNDASAMNRGYGGIYLGQNIGVNEGDGGYGFTAINRPIPIAQEMKGVDITAVMFHEIGHSLGISADFSKRMVIGDTGIKIGGLSDCANDPASFARHLYDQNGQRMTGDDMTIITPGDLRRLKSNPADFAVFREVAGYEKDAVSDGDFFVVDETNAFSGREGRAFLTFRGQNVSEALGGKRFTGANGGEIDGIPINTWERGTPEFSHIDLARSVMSHQAYRSYNGFIEAELAVLQDIGYEIDRKNFYGCSVYQDGQTFTNAQGFSARNAEGTAYVDGYNTTTYGVGLHVYGSNNNITQKGNIWTRGAAAVGIRVDGLNDTVTVPRGTEVHGDGTCGAGVLVAYGKNHVINIDGTVTGDGENGSGIWFEFGANALGATSEYRGSYLRYKREIRDGEISRQYNLRLNEYAHRSDDFSITDRANGDTNDKMATLNVSGTVSGDRAAIYIAEEAFVDHINLNEGAVINGDIVNLWKVFDADAFGLSDAESCTEDERIIEGYKHKIYPGGLMLQYDGRFIPYKKYVPGLVTNLNFNADMDYAGHIIGRENMKMNVNRGVLRFGGAADVVNVRVANGASLFGGSFTVNDMTAKLATGYADSTTGQFINHGTMGAASKDTTMNITGRLVSDGNLRAWGGGEKGWIDVSGAADINGSVATVTNALPDETWTVLKAGTVTGALANPAGHPAPATGMLDATGVVNGNTVTVTTVAANHLGAMTPQQAGAYAAVEEMQRNFAGDARRNELRGLYSLDPSGARQALTAISASGAPRMVSLVQQSTLAGQVISDRLRTAFSRRPVEVTVPASHLADGGGDGLRMHLELPVAQENDAWVKFTKNWGDLRGGADYHGSAVSGGYDRRLNDDWRGGVFFGYQATSLTAASSGGDIHDARLGVYAGYHRNAADAYLYADYGWIRNKLRRGLGMPGLGAAARYRSHLAEIGGEYKYDLHANDGKTWHVSPYAGFQLSWLNQGGYAESGAGIFNQQVAGKHNAYFAGQLGVELKRCLGQGRYGLRLGVKHAFAGADPTLSFRYEGYDGQTYTLRNDQDKTHVILALSGETEFARGWFLEGEAQLQKGPHDRDISAVVQFKRVW